MWLTASIAQRTRVADSWLVTCYAAGAANSVHGVSRAICHRAWGDTTRFRRVRGGVPLRVRALWALSARTQWLPRVAQPAGALLLETA